jgi:hypothetical protein
MEVRTFTTIIFSASALSCVATLQKHVSSKVGVGTGMCPETRKPSSHCFCIPFPCLCSVHRVLVEGHLSLLVKIPFSDSLKSYFRQTQSPIVFFLRPDEKPPVLLPHQTIARCILSLPSAVFWLVVNKRKCLCRFETYLRRLAALISFIATLTCVYKQYTVFSSFYLQCRSWASALFCRLANRVSDTENILYYGPRKLLGRILDKISKQ